MSLCVFMSDVCVAFDDGCVWDSKVTDDIKPPTRCANSLTHVNGCLYVFGGFNFNLKHLNDFWVYNIRLNEWNDMSSLYNMPTSLGHKIRVYKGNNLVLFGGKTKDKILKKYKFYSHLYVYNIEMNKWNKIECYNEPHTRAFHGMAIVKNKLIIHAGLTSNNTILKDICYINMNNVINNNSPKWIHIENNIGCINAHLFLSYQSRFIVYGGNTNYKRIQTMDNILSFYIDDIFIDKLSFIERYISTTFNIDSNKLVTHTIGKFVDLFPQNECALYPKIPSRYYLDGCILKHNNDSYIFIFGGSLKKICYNDSYLVKLNPK